MKYSHFYDKEGNLLSTIAFIEKGESVFYGMTIVSLSEPRNRVNKAFGRFKASCRLDNAINGANSNWRPGDDIFIKTVNKVGFSKLGQMSKGKFVESLKTLKAISANKVWVWE